MSSFSLTKSQELIWLGQQLSPKSPLYNMVFTFDIEGDIKKEVFTKAFQKLVEQADSLRMTFHEKEGQPYLKINSTIDFSLSFYDFSTESANKESLIDWINERKLRVFDLSQQNFDTALIKTSNGYTWYFNQHHIVSDGWSFGVVYQQLSKLYGIYLNKSENKDIPMLPTYESFIKKESKMQSADDFKISEKYWSEKLQQKSDPLNMGNYHNKRSNTASRRYEVVLNKEKSNAVIKLIEQKGFKSLMKPISLMNVFSALTYLLIHQLGNAKNISIGLPFHNRLSKNDKSTVGLFMELFCSCVSVDEDETFLSLYQKVREESFGLLRHASPGKGTAELAKSFEALINFIPLNFDDFNEQSTQVNWFLPDHMDAHHHLKVQVADFSNTGQFTLYFDFNKEVFDDSKCEKITKYFLHLLDQVLVDSKGKIRDYSLLNIKDTEQLLVEFNDTEKEYDESGTLIDLFEKQVSQNPGRPAIKYENESLNYAALNARCNQLANFLITKGVKKGDVIGLLLERSFEMIISILAIQKVGGAYLPIEPNYPEDRIQYVLENSNADFLLSNSKYLGLVTGKVNDLVALDEVQDVILKQSVQLNNLTELDDLAYVIYTSGSTGNPKGVMISHRAIRNRILWMREEFNIDSSDKILQKTPYSFDVSVWEFMLPIVSGAQLVIAKPNGHKDPQYLSEIINSEAVTVTHFVPSMLSQFVENTSLINCKSLKHVFSSGEALPKNLATKFLQNSRGIDLHNLYGPTEAAVDVTHWTCSLSDDHDTVPIGKPVSNTQTYILNEYLKLVPLGEVGELYLGGLQLANGYINREDLTNDRFIENPFDLSGSTKLYKTGDLASYDEKGVIIYHGRNDDQVKLRGFRIELGEIENRLSQVEKILNAKVILIGEPVENNQKIIAFIVHSGDIDKNQLRIDLSMKLPEYMIPSEFIKVEDLPITQSGKVDTNSLIANYNAIANETNEEESFVGPRNEIEEFISDIWIDVFGIKNISVLANFLELGGHSLMAIKIAARIREQLEIEIPLNTVFEVPSIAMLSEFLENKMEEIMGQET